MSEQPKKKMRPVTSVIGDDELKEIIAEYYEAQGYKTCEMEQVVDVSAGNFEYKFKMCGNSFECECELRRLANVDSLKDTHSALQQPIMIGDDFVDSDIFEE